MNGDTVGFYTDGLKSHRKVLLNSFYLNGRTYPQTQNVRTTLYSIINSKTEKYCLTAVI